jgi:putative RecB family exonuclease
MPTYSHSQLSTYETCPHQYKLSYIDKIEAKTEGVEAFMGSRVHDALEKLYLDLLRVNKLNSQEEIFEFYHQEWDKNWNDELVQIARKEYTPEDYRRKGEKCLSDYYKRYYPFDQGRTVGLEDYITFPLNEEKGYWIHGYVDRIAIVDRSVLEIHDYKTAGKLPSQAEVDSDRQLAFYQMGAGKKWGDIEEVRLIWHYLSFDMELRSSRTQEKLGAVCEKTMELIRKIETDLNFLPKEGPLCAWCDYQGLCPKRKHRIAVGGLPVNEYLNEEGVALVNRYAELSEKKRALNEEIDLELARVEEALYAFAEKKELGAVFGSDHVARIKIEFKEKYPLKGDPRRRTLDEFVKKSGKWMDVSDLNPWMLARVISRNNWPPALAKRVKEFCTSERSQSIVLSKLKERE